MKVTIVDYNSGNISSVINSFKEVAKEKVNIEVSSDLDKINSSDKVILPGQGSFKNCIEALKKIGGLADTLNEFVIIKKKPVLGICVGLQMFADIGYEETKTEGLGWISGNVLKQGQINLPKGSGLNQAISMSGGPKLLSGNVEFLRFNEFGETERRSFRFSPKARINTKNNPILLDGDIVHVNQSLLDKANKVIGLVADPILRSYGLYSIFN